jgi:hypothetical protein
LGIAQLVVRQVERLEEANGRLSHENQRLFEENKALKLALRALGKDSDGKG